MGANGHQNGGGNGQSSPPIAIPGGGNNDDNDNNHHRRYFEGASLLPTTSSSLTNRFSACRPIPSSPWGTDTFLGTCSPMVSGPRGNLRLPNLDLREARRVKAAAANARLARSSSGNLRRSRSHSLGNEEDGRQLGGSGQSSPLLLGEAMLNRRTPSGLSLMDLNDDSVGFTKADVESYDYDNDEGYGATATTEVTTSYTEPLKEVEDTVPIKTSQSCTIPEARRPSPPASPPPTKANGIESQNSLLEDLKREFESQSNPPILSLLYAFVNLSIVLPVIMSFGSIIYHDDFFRPYLSVLMKLTVFSGAVHQLTFTTFSSLPFAVGQVQDAGLIFLSAMARDLVSRLRLIGADDKSILATVTIGLSIYTAVLGCSLIVIGKFKLASYCQLLPSSVVGGYLAYIGFFCGQSGLALMASVDVTGLAEWYKFFNWTALTFLTPGVLGGCTIYFSVRTFRHMAVLPSCIVMLMIAFYGILYATGTSVQEATEIGWINETVDAGSWTHTWDFLKVEKVVWSVLPSQGITLLAMISVVALSSSLDIAAIEIELKRPLDYNHELKTVGLSNIISGLAGGYTGSYIFSQTIFSLRMGIRSRLMGYTIAVLALLAHDDLLGPDA
ncbi:hypothetical protein ACHAXR_007882 [Thalassiosira sp. AJA248-18]